MYCPFVYIIHFLLSTNCGLAHLWLFYLYLGHYDWKEGFVSGAVYYYDEKLIDLLTNVYSRASYTNPLHSDVFPGVNKMEAEVVAMAARLFHGSSTACGTVSLPA